MIEPSTTEEASLQAICDQGLRLHQAGRLDEARRLYETVLAANPDHFDALHLLGVWRLQTGQPAPGAALIARAVEVRPDAAPAYGNLANALNSLGRYEEALAVSDRAIALDAGFAQAHGNRGQALRALGRAREALESYARVVALRPSAEAWRNQAAVLRELDRLEAALESYAHAIALRPDDAEIHRSRGVVLGELGRPAEAIESFDAAIALDPSHAEAFVGRGLAFRELGRAAAALASFERVIALRPDHAQAWCNRGAALGDLKRWDEAVESYDQAIALKPDYVEAFTNKVVPLRELRRPEAALEAADRAIALRPDYADAHNNRGSTLAEMRRLDEALGSFERAVALDPDHARAWNNRGQALHELRRLGEAMASFDRAIALKPDYADAQHHQAMCRLALGDFAHGWTQYEWRWRTASPPHVRELEARRWLGGEDIAGRTILLHGEQGLGDRLQFCRYAADVAALGAKVLLEAPPPLARLFARLEGVDQLVGMDEAAPPHDLQTPLMSLPLALGAKAREPDRGPYLSAAPEDAAAWAARLAGSGRRRAGLCWAGGSRPDQPLADAIDKRRSLALSAFAPLADVQNVDFYSLQKGPPAAQLDEAQARGWRGPEVIDLTADLKDLADTAALIVNLDLVIACDTAVAHLAGGLGKPVWILSRFDTCWRWLDDREDSPWYPSARLFRQPESGDWESVIQRVRTELRSWASAR